MIISTVFVVCNILILPIIATIFDAYIAAIASAAGLGIYLAVCYHLTS